MASTLSTNVSQASTIQILNKIRSELPDAQKAKLDTIKGYDDLRKVGKALESNPGLLNDYLNGMVNRITKVVIGRLLFDNRFKRLKQGVVETGDTIEQVYLNLIKAVEYNPDKVGSREFARSLPDMQAVFHTINWQVQYPITISEIEISRAFLSFEGVSSLIESLIQQIYTSAEYDEFLLYKYMLIKAITSGKVKPLGVGDGTDPKAIARVTRATTTRLQFPSSAYNEYGVQNSTIPGNMLLIIDADTQATLDVDVLAMAFNIDRANVLDRVIVLDDWETFDSDRFSRVQGDFLDQVTTDELNIMKGIRGVLVDVDWFQVWDKPLQVRETVFGSSLERNFWLHVWKIVSHSPFHNIVALTNDGTITPIPASFTATVQSRDTAGGVTTMTLDFADIKGVGGGGDPVLVQTEDLLAAKVAVTPRGSVFFAQGATSAGKLTAKVDTDEFTAGADLTSETKVGTVLTFTKASHGRSADSVPAKKD